MKRTTAFQECEQRVFITSCARPMSAVLASIAVLLTVVACASKSSVTRSAPRDPFDASTSITFIDINGSIQAGVTADRLDHTIARLERMPEEDRPQIIVLRIDSMGGDIQEADRASDVIHDRFKPSFRTVAWVQSAIDASCLLAMTCEEIYLTKPGILGGKARRGPQDKASYQELSIGEQVSRRGGYSPLVLQSMLTPSPLSCNIDADGTVFWRNDTNGEFLVCPPGRTLTFNSIDAAKYRVSLGTADTKDELAQLMGCTEWHEFVIPPTP